MEQKRLEQLQASGKDWRAKLEQRNTKNLEKAARKKQRAESFADLATRNRELNIRARTLFRIAGTARYDEEDAGQSRLIVLKTGNEAEHDWIVGRIERTDSHKGQGFRFTMHATDACNVSRIRQKLSATSSPSLYTETTMMTSHLSSDHKTFGDEILEYAEDHSPGRRITPVSALFRYFKHRHISDRLANSRETADMFEQAMADPELNPQLAPLTAQLEQRSQQAG